MLSDITFAEFQSVTVPEGQRLEFLVEPGLCGVLDEPLVTDLDGIECDDAYATVELRTPASPDLRVLLVAYERILGIVRRETPTPDADGGIGVAYRYSLLLHKDVFGPLKTTA
jgi:hypothetical protein